jgi:PleD family two-component response regulator
MSLNYKYNRDLTYSKKRKLNILIVDDDINSLMLFKEILEARGHNVSALDEGMKCISKCMNNTYDIIFVDYHIGDIDGVELTDCLKDVLHTKSIIFAYTGDNSKDAIDKFKNIGMKGAIIKPIEISVIDNIINQFEMNIESNEKIINLTNKKLKSNSNSIIYFD